MDHTSNIWLFYGHITQGTTPRRNGRNLVEDLFNFPIEEKETPRTKGGQGKVSTSLSKFINPTKGTKARSGTAKTVQAAVRKGTRGKLYRPAAQDFLQHVSPEVSFCFYH